MKIHIIKNQEDNSTDLIIVSNVTTKEQIQEAINQVKSRNEYSWDDILEAIVNFSDCIIYDRWTSKKDGSWNEIYY